MPCAGNREGAEWSRVSRVELLRDEHVLQRVEQPIHLQRASYLGADAPHSWCRWLQRGEGKVHRGRQYAMVPAGA